jgi:hypothetical protein
MDPSRLPRHVVARIERRWAQKLKEQVHDWKGTRSALQTVTDAGVPVVHRNKREASIQTDSCGVNLSPQAVSNYLMYNSTSGAPPARKTATHFSASCSSAAGADPPYGDS